MSEEKPSNDKAKAPKPEATAQKSAPGAKAAPDNKAEKAKPHHPPEGHEPAVQSDSSGSALGGILGMLALIVAILAAGGAYYLWQQLMVVGSRIDDIKSGVSERISTVETVNQAQEMSLRNLGDSVSRKLDNRLQSLAQEQQQLRDELEESLYGLKNQLGREQKDWVIAETEYLLRIANRRLQLENDVQSAIVALQMADKRLLNHADPAYNPVREQIATELQNLETVNRTDIPGMAMRLSGVIENLQQLPLSDNVIRRRNAMEQELAVQEEQEPQQVESLAQLPARIWEDLKRMVRISHNEQQTAEPLLAPEQRYFLEQNLQLKLESARLALLRGEPQLYRRTLGEAADWLRRYYDTGRDATGQVLSELESLSNTDINLDTPDISGSLRSLRRITQRLGINLDSGSLPAVTITPGSDGQQEAREKQP